MERGYRGDRVLSKLNTCWLHCGDVRVECTDLFMVACGVTTFVRKLLILVGFPVLCRFYLVIEVDLWEDDVVAKWLIG